jgi:hypothetical protein
LVACVITLLKENKTTLWESGKEMEDVVITIDRGYTWLFLSILNSSVVWFGYVNGPPIDSC